MKFHQPMQSLVKKPVKEQLAIAVILCLLIGVLWHFVPHPVVPMAIGLAPLAILFVLHTPFLMVLLFVVFSFFRIHEAFPQLYSLKIPLLLSLASLSALAWHTIFTRKIIPYWRPELSLLAIFFALVTIGVPLADNMPLAISYYTGTYIKIGIMTLAIAWMTTKPGDFSLASRLIVIAGTAIALVAITRKAAGIGLVEGTRVTIGRDFGSMLGDPNDLALVLLFPMAFAVSLVLTPKTPLLSRLIGIVGVPLLFSGIIATQSRGGLLGIVAVFGIFGYRKIKSKLLLAAIGAVGMLGLITLAGISDRKSGGSAEEGVDASAMGRIYAWEAAIGMAVANPLTGVGINNFLVNYFFYSSHWDGMNHAVHSTWFGVLAETGFLGLIVFVSMIVRLILSAVRSLNAIEANEDTHSPAVHAASQAVLGGLVATIVSGTFLTQGFVWPIYILTALLVAVSRWVELNIPKTISATYKKRSTS